VSAMMAWGSSSAMATSNEAVAVGSNCLEMGSSSAKGTSNKAPVLGRVSSNKAAVLGSNCLEMGSSSAMGTSNEAPVLGRVSSSSAMATNKGRPLWSLPCFPVLCFPHHHMKIRTGHLLG